MRLRGVVLCRFVLSASVAATLLAGCGGSQPLIGAPDATSGSGALPYNKTFHYTGKKQSFKVPAGVSSITVVALGAAGHSSPSHRTVSGRGGRVYAVIPVQSGERLYIFVGGAGFPYHGDGGFNGGGNGGGFYGDGYGGGGASDIREGGDKLADRILVAGGGGGAGEGDGGDGGAGGGSIGGAGLGAGSGLYGGGGGGGGTQTAGGAAGKRGKGGYPKRDHGHPGKPGKFGVGGKGGNGGSGVSSSSDGLGGGGGGGGYYGGGGGGGGFGGEGGSSGGGAGGGSSYIEPSAETFRFWQGWKNATTNGLVVISW